jgi:cytidylate kinase
MSVITISRQVGSGGDEIAALVSKRLRYRLLDGALIQKLGPELGLAEPGEIADLTAEKHHVAGLLERLFAVSPAANAEVLPIGSYDASGEASDDRSNVVVTKIINHVYGLGNAVMGGRGAMVVLKDKPGVLHVRVVAPLEKRCEYLMKRDKIDSFAARDMAKEADGAQADYIRRYFLADIYDPLLYHLIINTGKVTLEAAASAIADTATRLLEPSADH